MTPGPGVKVNSYRIGREQGWVVEATVEYWETGICLEVGVRVKTEWSCKTELEIGARRGS